MATAQAYRELLSRVALPGCTGSGRGISSQCRTPLAAAIGVVWASRTATTPRSGPCCARRAISTAVRISEKRLPFRNRLPGLGMTACSALDLSTTYGLPSALRPPTANVLSAFTQARWATKKASGFSKNNRKRPRGKKRGPKQKQNDYVRPDYTLVRQRLIRYHAGHNVHTGKDNTLVASVAGWVKFYKDAEFPGKTFVGVVTQKSDNLPYVEGVTRERRSLGGLVDISKFKRDLLDKQAAYRMAQGELS